MFVLRFDESFTLFILHQWFLNFNFFKGRFVCVLFEIMQRSFIMKIWWCVSKFRLILFFMMWLYNVKVSDSVLFWFTILHAWMVNLLKLNLYCDFRPAKYPLILLSSCSFSHQKNFLIAYRINDKRTYVHSKYQYETKKKHFKFN